MALTSGVLLTERRIGDWRRAWAGQANHLLGTTEIAAAKSWLVNCVIEGFAAYGHALYPSVTGTGETEDSREEQ